MKEVRRRLDRMDCSIMGIQVRSGFGRPSARLAGSMVMRMNTGQLASDEDHLGGARELALNYD